MNENSDLDKVAKLNRLRGLQAHPGWVMDLLPYITRKRDEGFKEFIDLPVDQKTGKKALRAQYLHVAMRDLLKHLQDEIDECLVAKEYVDRQSVRTGQ